MATDRYQRGMNDTGREARRRLIVGLSGLSVMLLLVLLVGWATAPARQEADLARAQAQAAGVSNPGVPQEKNDSSLVDLGVEPALNNDAAPAVPRAETPIPQVQGDRLVVPDLQPDPQLDPGKTRR